MSTDAPRPSSILGALALGLFSFSSGCQRCGTPAEPETPPAVAPLQRRHGERHRVSDDGRFAHLPNAASALGTNLDGMTDWSTQDTFIDVFKSARPFFSGTEAEWSDDRELDVDPHGWIRRLAPNQVARTILLTDHGHFRAGDYIVRYDGDAEITYSASGRFDEAASRPNRHVVNLDPARDKTGLILIIHSVGESGLRNMRIYPPGGACSDAHSRYCDASHPCPSDAGECLSFEEHAEELVFHPDFLARTERYGMLRFMDMMATNGSTIEQWSQRPHVEDATYTKNGVPVELLIDLANRLHAQPWFCVPHRADDDYIRRLAELLEERVEPSLPIWIEYSNEVWNGIFQQNQYAAERAAALGLGTEFPAALRYYARRTHEVHRLFEGIVASERLVRVVAAQAGFTGVAEAILEDSALASNGDALAIAPYFGWNVSPDDIDRAHRMNLEQLVAHTRDQLLPEARGFMVEHARIARRHGLELVAYEAGQHFIGHSGAENDEALSTLLDAINRDPRMGELYSSYLRAWREAGGHWLNHFNHCGAYTKWGRWGALEYIRQPREEAPKFDAMVRFMDENPRWW